MHTIPNSIIRGQLFALNQSGIDLSTVYQSAGITELELQNNTCQVTAEQFATLMRTAFELADDEAMGYTQRPMRVGTFRMLCHATIDCQNLRRALVRMCEFFRILSDEYHWRLEENGEDAILIFDQDPNPNLPNDYFIACMMTILWRWSSWMIDTPILLNRVYFQFGDRFLDYTAETPNPEQPVKATDRVSLAPIFRAPIYFNQSKNRLVLPCHYLNLPIKQTSQTLVPFLANSPECLLSHYHSENSLSGQIRQFLAQSSEQEQLTLEQVAEQFAMSGQSLARRLRKEGHQFQEIKDKVRKSRAIHLLLATDKSISDITTELGFSEDSVFYRSFKKWTGMTPKSYREQS